MDLIRAKSHEDCDCLIWDGAMSTSGKSKLPFINVNRKPTPVRRWIAENVLGLKTEGLLASNKCGNSLCVDPDHVQMMTRAQLQKFTTKKTKFQQNPTRNYKLAMAARARSPHSTELIEKIREMEGTCKGIARDLGVNFHVVYRVKSGAYYKSYTNNPWAGL